MAGFGGIPSPTQWQPTTYMPPRAAALGTPTGTPIGGNGMLAAPSYGGGSLFGAPQAAPAPLPQVTPIPTPSMPPQPSSGGISQTMIGQNAPPPPQDYMAQLAAYKQALAELQSNKMSAIDAANKQQQAMYAAAQQLQNVGETAAGRLQGTAAQQMEQLKMQLLKMFGGGGGNADLQFYTPPANSNNVAMGPGGQTYAIPTDPSLFLNAANSRNDALLREQELQQRFGSQFAQIFTDPNMMNALSGQGASPYEQAAAMMRAQAGGVTADPAAEQAYLQFLMTHQQPTYAHRTGY